MHQEQCCQSKKWKTLDRPIKKQKTQGQISLQLAVISWKPNFFPQKTTFPRKNDVLSTKIFYDPF